MISYLTTKFSRHTGVFFYLPWLGSWTPSVGALGPQTTKRNSAKSDGLTYRGESELCVNKACIPPGLPRPRCLSPRRWAAGAGPPGEQFCLALAAPGSLARGQDLQAGWRPGLLWDQVERPHWDYPLLRLAQWNACTNPSFRACSGSFHLLLPTVPPSRSTTCLPASYHLLILLRPLLGPCLALGLPLVVLGPGQGRGGRRRLPPHTDSFLYFRSYLCSIPCPLTVHTSALILLLLLRYQRLPTLLLLHPSLPTQYYCSWSTPCRFTLLLMLLHHLLFSYSPAAASVPPPVFLLSCCCCCCFTFRLPTLLLLLLFHHLSSYSPAVAAAPPSVFLLSCCSSYSTTCFPTLVLLLLLHHLSS